MKNTFDRAIFASIALGIWIIVLQNAGEIGKGVTVSQIKNRVQIEGTSIMSVGINEFGMTRPLPVVIEKQ